MSTLEQSETENVMPAPSSIFHPGFGDKLRLAREALGLVPSDVAAKLKLGERQIEAIEAEDFAHLPSEVFIRGFVRNYARLVKIDPEQLIVPMDIHAVVSDTVTAPSEGVIFSAPGLRRWVLLPMLALGFFVLLVALIYYWLRQGEETLLDTPIVSAPAMLAPAQEPVAAPPLAGAPESAAAAGSAQAPASLVEAAPVPAPAPVAVAIPAPVAATSAPPTPAVTPAAGKARTLRFAPALDAWIQVVDGKGNRFSKLVPAGSVETFAGEPPFKLVVGEAAQVQLSYDGHRIDLTPFIGQKVARLTLE